MKTLTTTIALLALVSSTQIFAQAMVPHRKPATELAHPIMDATPTAQPLRMPAMPVAPDVQLNEVPEYAEIHAPIRWYALENAENDNYWNNVDAERIWIALKPGTSIEDENIKTFLQKNGLTELVRESMNKSLSNHYIFALPGASVEQVLSLVRDARDIDGMLYAEPSAIYRSSSTPNDPLWNMQWGPFVINTQEAWQYTTGGSWNVIAVIDDAVDWSHPDLFNQVWYGWDYGMNDNDPTPDHFSQDHGTHVTGTIAASINNNTGIAGMVNDTVYFAKVTDATYNPEEGNFSDVAIVDALYDIATIGRIGVINMSLGGGAPTASMEQACNAAWNAGKLLVVASGNESASSVSYPAAYQACMAVGSLGANGTDMYLASYSNYGSAQEIVAPGGDSNTGFGVLSTVLFNEYNVKDGTSMACPHVAGVAGLMKAANPEITNFEMRQILNSTATDFGNPGWDVVFGYGMVNAGLAVQIAAGGPALSTTAQNSEMSINLFPNPTTDVIYLQGKGQQVTGAIEVFDLSGKKVHAQKSQRAEVQSINVQHLPKGMYLIRVMNGEKPTSLRFVKQ